MTVRRKNLKRNGRQTSFSRISAKPSRKYVIPKTSKLHIPNIFRTGGVTQKLPRITPKTLFSQGDMAADQQEKNKDILREMQQYQTKAMTQKQEIARTLAKYKKEFKEKEILEKLRKFKMPEKSTWDQMGPLEQEQYKKIKKLKEKAEDAGKAKERKLKMMQLLNPQGNNPFAKTYEQSLVVPRELTSEEQAAKYARDEEKRNSIRFAGRSQLNTWYQSIPALREIINNNIIRDQMGISIDPQKGPELPLLYDAFDILLESFPLFTSDAQQYTRHVANVIKRTSELQTQRAAELNGLPASNSLSYDALEAARTAASRTKARAEELDAIEPPETEEAAAASAGQGMINRPTPRLYKMLRPANPLYMKAPPPDHQLQTQNEEYDKRKNFFKTRFEMMYGKPPSRERIENAMPKRAEPMATRTPIITDDKRVFIPRFFNLPFYKTSLKTL